VDTGVVINSHPTAVDVDQHSVAKDTEDVGHHSIGGIENVAGLEVLGSFAENLSVGWDEDGCYSQMPVPRT
jgi:hypothetical protein